MKDEVSNLKDKKSKNLMDVLKYNLNEIEVLYS